MNNNPDLNAMSTAAFTGSKVDVSEVPIRKEKTFEEMTPRERLQVEVKAMLMMAPSSSPGVGRKTQFPGFNRAWRRKLSALSRKLEAPKVRARNRAAYLAKFQTA